MHLVTHLSEVRGKRTIKDISELAGVNPATVRQIEQGKLIPREGHVDALERAYGVPIEKWYSRRALLALQEGDAPA